ncbi:hypothetical protein C8T65DRAFT_9366 [Cerioporus squamosus]|nr:hypothetical protein C8T65DRAFT_9366 [Cerioporus squamosus]
MRSTLDAIHRTTLRRRTSSSSRRRTRIRTSQHGLATTIRHGRRTASSANASHRHSRIPLYPHLTKSLARPQPPSRRPLTPSPTSTVGRTIMSSSHCFADRRCRTRFSTRTLPLRFISAPALRIPRNCCQSSYHAPSPTIALRCTRCTAHPAANLLLVHPQPFAPDTPVYLLSFTHAVLSEVSHGRSDNPPLPSRDPGTRF